MSEMLEKAVAQLSEKLGDVAFPGSAKFVVEGEGSIILDKDGVRISDEEADVSLSATLDVFEGIFDGSQSPTAAFMTGKLRIDGNMGMAMKLSEIF